MSGGEARWRGNTVANNVAMKRVAATAVANGLIVMGAMAQVVVKHGQRCRE